MKHRIWSIPKTQFETLIEIVALTENMRNALRSRYDENCCNPRSLTCMVFDVSERGLNKAEKKVIEAHEKIRKAYCH